VRPRVLLTGSLLLLAAGGLGAARCGRSPAEPAGHALPLRAGQYLHLVVEQRGVDIIAKLRDPAGRLILQVDSPSDAWASEELFLVAGATGRYELTIEAWGGAGDGGRSAIRMAALRPAAAEDRKRAAAAGAFSRARLLDPGNPEAAAASYREAAGLWGELAEADREAWALFRWGQLYGNDPIRRREKIRILARALDLFREARDEHQQAIVLFHLGKAWLLLDEVERAGDCFQQAAALWETLGDPEESAARLNDLAVVRVRQGRIHAAIDLYSRAIEGWQRLGIWRSLAATRTNLGLLYATLGESRLALDQYRSALALLEQQPDPALRAVALDQLGDVLLRVDGPEAALERFREALKLRRERRDLRGQAVTLNSIGQAQLEANRPLQALRAFEAAGEIFQKQREPLAVAVVFNNLGLAYERLGQPGRARDLYRQALDRAVGRSPQAEEAALFGLARVARREGKLDEAERWMAHSLDRIEAIRSQMWRPDLRSSYQAARQEQYAFLIDLLAERHRSEPQGDHAARAFAVAERARARSLLDLLAAARQSPRPEELRGLDDLSRRINDRHRELLAVASQGVADDELERELTGLLQSLRQAEAAVAGPRLAEGTLPLTLSLHQVQTGLLDEETLFLEYFLGEEKSFLWAVTPSAARFVATLPGRAQIEAAARRTWERLAASHRQTGEVAARQAAAQLSELILGPVADLLTRRRLVIVAPGALQAVPFAALPRPGGPEEPAGEPRPLILDHEIVSLPSASVLGALRARLAGRRPPPGLLAVVADPALGPAGRSSRANRLPYARREAEEILALTGAGPVLAVSGAAASRELAQSGRLRDYRILHFATHGLYNDLHPELSALALADLDASGRPVDGHLRAYEVSSLDLRADLVVLSACRTGLAGETGGAGLVGLTHGFLQAGAPRLIVSLWDVDDRATSELMKRLYTGLLREKLSPAAALRQAQISLLREEHWRAPYHWAGFLLQGDWRSSRFEL
jgi:CHAT domain-containing protein/Tfp pilus assembly protein PilF